MKELILATQNPDKYREIKEILKDLPGILRWAGEFPDIGEIDETGETLEENAAIKAVYVANFLNKPAVADDTGLFVNSLDGSPGVHSARYAGPQAKYEDNVRKLLEELQGIPGNKRTAAFRTVVCLAFPDGKKYFTEGVVTGSITSEPIGTEGFGYDPVFLVNGTGKTFADMSAEEKNSISHRYIAFKKMAELIKNREVA